MAEEQELRAAVRMEDGVSQTLSLIVRSLRGTIKAMEDMRAALSKNIDDKTAKDLDRAFKQAKSAISDAASELPKLGNSAKTQIGQAKKAVSDTSAEIAKVGSAAKAAKQPVDQIGKSLKGMGAVKLNAVLDIISKVGRVAISVVRKVAQAAKSFMDLSDQMSGIQAKLKLITGSEAEAAAMNDRIVQAANNARGSYADMAAAVTKLGMTAKGAFKNQGQLVDTVEQMQKHFKLAGSSSQEAASATLQLTQALSSGKLQGEEFRSVMENAPTILQAIADSMGEPLGKLKEMAAEGQITSEVIVKALGDAAADTDKKFKQLPVTFAELATQAKNTLQVKLQPTLAKVSEMLNSETFQNTFKALLDAGTSIIDALLPMIDAILPAVQVVLDAVVGLLQDPEVQGAIQMIFGFLADALTQLGPLMAALMPLLALILGLLSSIMPVLAPLIQIITGIIDILTPLIQLGLMPFLLVLDLILPILTDLLKILGAAIGLIGKLARGISDFINTIIGKWRELMQKMLKWVEPILKLFNISVGGMGVKSDPKADKKEDSETKSGQDWGSLLGAFGGTEKNTAKTAKNTSKMSESLEWAVDYAKQKTATRLTNVGFTIDMSGMNNTILHEGGYLGIQSAVVQGVMEAYARMPKGAHVL